MTSKTSATPSLGDLLKKLNAARSKKAKASAANDLAEEEFKAAKAAVLEALQAQGMEKASGAGLTVAVKVSQVATVKDWDEFYKFIKKTGYFHLLQRRVSDPAWRELAEQKPVPGVEAFTKTDLGITATK